MRSVARRCAQLLSSEKDETDEMALWDAIKRRFPPIEQRRVHRENDPDIEAVYVGHYMRVFEDGETLSKPPDLRLMPKLPDSRPARTYILAERGDLLGLDLSPKKN